MAPAAEGQTSLLEAMKADKAKADQAYADQLKKLYLTDNFNDALVARINELLAMHRYTGKRIRSADDDRALTYSISVTHGDSILVVKKDHLQEAERLTTDKVSVFGQNAFLKYNCEVRRAFCVVKKPDLYSDWFKISYDEGAAKELSTALAYLIRNLQQGSKL